MERWVDIEADEEVASSLFSIITDVIERSEIEFVEDTEMGADSADAAVDTVAAELPALADLYEMFSDAQRTAFNCNLPDASMHLHRALNIFRDAVRAQNRAGKRQLLVYEMLGPRPTPMED